MWNNCLKIYDDGVFEVKCNVKILNPLRSAHTSKYVHVRVQELAWTPFLVNGDYF